MLGKKRKPSVGLITTIALVIALFFTCACDPVRNKAEINLVESGQKLIVIEALETKGSLYDALLQLQSEGKIDFTGNSSDTGFYLTSVNGYTLDSSLNEFWAIYTTLGEYEGVSYSDLTYGSYVYEDKTLGSATYGVSGLPMIKGNIYILSVSTF